MIAARDDAAFQGCAAGAGADTIRLDAQVYVLSLPGAGEGASMTGDLDLGAQSLRITGKGAAATAIDASGLDRAFDLLEGASLALEDLTIRNGRSPAGRPGRGGRRGPQPRVGVRAPRGLRRELRRRRLVGGRWAAASSAGAAPGARSRAAWESGPPPSLTIIDSSFIGNLAGDGGQFSGPGSGNGGNGGRGGAIEAIGGTVAISGTTFAGNLAGDGGNGGTGPVTPGAGGDGGVGGAIYAAFGSVAITNSTFAANRAGAGGLTGANPSMPARGGTGGAMFADSSVLAARAEFSTFSGNLRGPATFADGANGLAGGSAAGSILADPAPACQSVAPGPLRNVALPGDPSCAGPRLDGDPRLGPLAANGGPTLTLAPGAGSAAIDALAGVGLPGGRPARPPAPPARRLRRGRGRGPAGGRGRRARRARWHDRRPAGLGAAPAAGRLPRRGLGRQRGGGGREVVACSSNEVVACASTDRHDGGIPPGRGRQGHVHRAAAGRRPQEGTTVRPARRRAVRGTPLRAQATSAGELRPLGRGRPERLRFTGRLRGRKLAPGRYTLVARLPRPATGRAAVAARAFRIVR